MAQSKFSKTDEYGFERPDNFDYQFHDQFMSTYLTHLAKQSQKWQEILKKNPTLKPNTTLKKAIRKGIPSEHRSRVWFCTSGAIVLKERNPQLYQRLLQQKHTPDIVSSIRVDLPRTFPENIHFYLADAVQEQLYRILVSFAHHNKDVGYCQGLNYIAGLLLLVTKDEERAFWLLLTLVDHILPKNYYSQRMAGLIVDINVLDKLVERRMPSVNQLLNHVNLSWPIITTKWFVCLFTEVLPTETVLRVWDCLFNEGNKILFRVSISIIRQHRSELLRCDDMAAVIDCFKALLQGNSAHDCNAFIERIFKESLTRKEIEELRLVCR